MPRRRKSKSSPIPAVGALILLVGIAGVLLWDAWGNRNAPFGKPAATQPPGEVTRSATLPPPSTQAPGTQDTIEVFFSDPLSGLSGGGPDVPLVQAVEGAQRSVDIAVYNLSLENLADALLAAHGRGVQVRLVMESEAMENRQPQRLRGAGIPIVGDQREGLMHNKFAIIDGAEVWTGSMNFTSTSSYNDFNNLVRLRSQRAAQDYRVEFEEMFTDGLFGPDGRADTPYPQVTLNGVPVKIFFSPDDGIADDIVRAIQGARRSVDFMAYSFTNDEIAAAVRERAATGVQVRGVFDESQVESNTGGEYDNLRQAGLDVRLDGINGLMHHKVIIIDGETVITGSYNFSNNAERNNDENLLIIHSPEIAGEYLRNFEEVYGSAK
jgi:phosphatidylserine/phosphatidylglycerophosphate/cardiolipin synthase-like enzyme